MEDTARITELLVEWRSGNELAERALLDLVYPHLRAIAANRLREEHPDRSLETTDLVQEAFVSLLGQRQASWKNRSHFFAIAARLMRRILADRARRQQRIKRGAGVVQLNLDALPDIAADTDPDWLWLHQALSELGEIDELAERVVELRFFGGLTEEESVEVLGASRATLTRKWRFARAWLEQKLGGDGP